MFSAADRSPSENRLAARLDFTCVLIDRQKYLRAREVIETLLSAEPGNAYYLSLDAAACVGLGKYEPAIAVYRQLLAESPRSADLYVSLGHALKAVGRFRAETRSAAMSVFFTSPVMRYRRSSMLQLAASVGLRSTPRRKASIARGDPTGHVAIATLLVEKAESRMVLLEALRGCQRLVGKGIGWPSWIVLV